MNHDSYPTTHQEATEETLATKLGVVDGEFTVRRSSGDTEAGWILGSDITKTHLRDDSLVDAVVLLKTDEKGLSRKIVPIDEFLSWQIMPETDTPTNPEVFPRVAREKQLGGEAMQGEVELEQPVAEEAVAESDALEVDKLDNISVELQKVTQTMEKDIETSSRLFNAAQTQLGVVRELMNSLYQYDDRMTLANVPQVLRALQERTVELRTLYAQAGASEIDRSAFSAVQTIEESASQIVRNTEVDETTRGFARAIVGALDTITQSKGVSQRGFDINAASGNLIAQSGQFLGRIHNLESLNGYDTVMDVRDRLAAVVCDLESYSETLQITQNPSRQALQELQQLQRQIVARS